MLILIAVLLALILWAILSPKSLKAALFIAGSVAFVFALKAIFYS